MLSESIAKLVQYGITTGLTPEEKEELLKEALENINYRDDEDFY